MAHVLFSEKMSRKYLDVRINLIVFSSNWQTTNYFIWLCKKTQLNNNLSLNTVLMKFNRKINGKNRQNKFRQANNNKHIVLVSVLSFVMETWTLNKMANVIKIYLFFNSMVDMS